MHQLKITDSTIHAVNVYREESRSESRTEGTSVKLTASQKLALSAIARERNVGCSTLIAHAVELFIALYPHDQRLLSNLDLMKPVLGKLNT